MTNGIGWSAQRAAIEDPEKRAAAIKASPVYRETPLEKSERTPSPLRAIPIIGPSAGAAVESLRQLDPTRVVSGLSAPVSPKQAKADVIQPATPPVIPTKKPTPVSPQVIAQATGTPSRAVRRTATTTTLPPSPADQALAEYNRLMGKESGGIGEAIVARGFMNRYQALKPFDLKQEEMAAEQTRADREQALRREELGLKKEELKSPTSAARERLLGAQASSEETRLKGLLRNEAALHVVQNPEAYSPEEVRRAKAHLDRATDERIRFELAKQQALEGGFGVEERATGGMIERYAVGGQIPTYGAAPQQNPMLAQYGQYLSAASKSGVAPVPFAKYIQLLESTRSQPEQTIGFEDGGEIPPGYAQPKDVDWGGVLSKGARGALRMEPKSAPAQEIAPASAPAATEDPSANFWTLDPEKQREIEEATKGYARGGAIDVSGRKLVGPGTGTSDSIPAVIDGNRPAALSHGEFVIPAHVVRAKGTEFFDKLIASYADKGQDNG